MHQSTCSASLCSAQNSAFMILEVHPACPECRADQLSPKGQGVQIIWYGNVIASFDVNLECIQLFFICLHLFIAMLFTFFSAEAVLVTTEAVSFKLLALAWQLCRKLLSEGSSSVCRSRPTILQKLCIGFVAV